MAKAKTTPRPLFGFGADESETTPSDVAGLTLAAIQDLELVIDRQRQAIEESDQRVAELAHRQSELATRVAALENLVRELARD